MIRRRTLLASSLAFPVAGAAWAEAPARLRVSTAAPPGDFLSRALMQMRIQVMAAAPALDIEVHPSGTLFKQGTEVPAMQRGTLEMSTMTTFEVAQQMPGFGFFDRGYLFHDYPHMRRVFDGPLGREYAAAVEKAMGITILATAYLGTRQVGLRRKRTVRTPKDLEGVRIRMPGGPEWLLLGHAIGADPVPLGMPEVYLALKTGTIDAQENPLTIFGAAKFHEVSEQVVLTAHMIQPVFINIATPAWARLSPQQQSALRLAAKAAAMANDEGRRGDEAKVEGSLAARGLAVETPDLAAFRAHADRVYAASDLAKQWDARWMKRVLAA